MTFTKLNIRRPHELARYRVAHEGRTVGTVSSVRGSTSVSWVARRGDGTCVGVHPSRGAAAEVLAR